MIKVMDLGFHFSGFLVIWGMQKPWAKLNWAACKSKKLFCSCPVFLQQPWILLGCFGRGLWADVNGESEVWMVSWQQLSCVRWVPQGIWFSGGVDITVLPEGVWVTQTEFWTPTVVDKFPVLKMLVQRRLLLALYLLPGKEASTFHL